MWKTKTLKRAQKELDDWSSGNKDYNSGRSGKYPAFEEYLGADKADEKYHNKINRPTVIKNRAISIFVAALIIAPALFGIFHIGSHLFAGATSGNNEPASETTTSASAPTPTEMVTPSETATESAQARPEPYVNKEGATVYPAADNGGFKEDVARSVSRILAGVIGALPYILGFLVLLFVLGLLIS